MGRTDTRLKSYHIFFSFSLLHHVNIISLSSLVRWKHTRHFLFISVSSHFWSSIVRESFSIANSEKIYLHFSWCFHSDAVNAQMHNSAGSETIHTHFSSQFRALIENRHHQCQYWWSFQTAMSCAFATAERWNRSDMTTQLPLQSYVKKRLLVNFSAHRRRLSRSFHHCHQLGKKALEEVSRNIGRRRLFSLRRIYRQAWTIVSWAASSWFYRLSPAYRARKWLKKWGWQNSVFSSG